MRCCDWEEGASGCWSCLPGTAGWDLWGMEPWCLAHTPESTLFPPCTCRREPPAKVATLLFLKYERLAHAGLVDSGCHEVKQENERFAKITHLAAGYTPKYQHQKFPTLTSVNSMDKKDYHAPSAIFEKNNQLSFHSESGLCQYNSDMKIQLVSKNQGTSNCRISTLLYTWFVWLYKILSHFKRATSLHSIVVRKIIVKPTNAVNK